MVFRPVRRLKVLLSLSLLDFAGSNGRRESQGSLSSGASLELGTSGSGRNEVSLSHKQAATPLHRLNQCFSKDPHFFSLSQSRVPNLLHKIENENLYFKIPLKGKKRKMSIKSKPLSKPTT